MTGSAAERKRIRAVTVAHLKAKSSVSDAAIFNSHVYPIATKQCPALNIFTPQANGKNEAQISHVPSFDYDLSMRVDATIAAKGDAWADILDDLCEEIDALVMGDSEFLATLDIARFAWHRSTISVSGEGEETIATAQIEYGLAFGWDYNPTIVDAFKKTQVNVDAIDPADANTGNEGEPGGYPGGKPGPDGRIEARVDIELEQEE